MASDIPSSRGLVPLAQPGEIERLCNELDQTQEQLAQTLNALQQSKAQFQAILDAVPGGVSWINADLEYLGINSRLAATLNLKPEELIGKPIGFLAASSAFNDFVRDFVNSTDTAASREIGMDVQGKQCTYLMMAQKYLLGQSAVFVGIDITERKRAEEQLYYTAYHDSLTGLHNRAWFIERLQQMIAAVKRHPQFLVALLFLDLDGFKQVNDSLGHATGDQLLVEVAHRLRANSRTEDSVARLGGDEFVILLDGVESLHQIIHVVERIQQSLAVPFQLEQQEVFTSTSIGIAVYSVEYDKAEDLLRDADIAMYRAKEQGRANYQIFDRSMHTEVRERLELESDLNRSFARGDFTLAYQPIIDLAAGSLAGFEVLVRWQRPIHGTVSPAVFIPVAEAMGLVIQLDRWILTEACRSARLWHTAVPTTAPLQPAAPLQPPAPLQLCVNLSSQNFTRPDLVEWMAQMLAETHFEARHLTLEITERAILENVQSVSATLRELKELGIRFSIDDFGTGYSSLSYLHQFPMDSLKIDRSFVSRMDTDAASNNIVQAIVTMAHSLELEVVAEGVETREQLVQLQGLRVNSAQGYLFSKPLDLASLAPLIQSGFPHLSSGDAVRPYLPSA